MWAPDGDPLTYSWSVDSALSSFDANTSPIPDLTCTGYGNFTVTLAVDDGQDTDSDTSSVLVPEILDHYKCYPISGKIFDTQVGLFDQFGQLSLVEELTVDRLCNTVTKTQDGDPISASARPYKSSRA